MKSLRTIINHFNPAKRSGRSIVSVFVFTVLAISGLGLVNPQGAAASSNDIVGGGVWNRSMNCGGDVGTIMAHYRIDCNLAGVVDGRACRDGNVYVGDRVVARDSRSIGRNPIQGNRAISIGGQTYYETHNSQALLSECLDTWVKLDGNGSFIYAIIKACGNPIWTPAPVVVNPPTNNPPTTTPPPAQQYAFACELATKQIRYVRLEEANSSRYSRNLADCKSESKKIPVCRLADKVRIEINESEFRATLHSKDFADCAETVVKKIEVCEIKTKAMITINENEFKASLYSTKPEDCAEKPVEELPQTGIADNLVATGIGAGSLLVAGSAYVGSRKDLMDKIFNR